MALRVALVVNVLPHYRAAFYRILLQRPDLDVRVFCQSVLPGMNLELIHDRFPDHVILVPATGSNDGQISWQWLPWRRLLTEFDVLFVHGNPRIVSNVVLATLARLMGRRVVLWGQAHTASANPWTERLRLAWWRWYENLFVYADEEIGWLQERGFRRQHIVAMNNGLDQRGIDAVVGTWDEQKLAQWRQSKALAGRTLVLSCARLDPKNCFDAWLDAMPAVISQFPDLVWCAIGDGRERKGLEARARELRVAQHVRWLGAIHEETELAPWFLSSKLLVHPGAIGLTLLHAFGYGLPVVTHGDPEGQMPEFEALEPGKTGLVYRRGDIASLADTVCRGLADEAGRCRMSAEALRTAREKYNVEIMVDRLVAMAKHAGSH
ncbi:MAG TPA: glycosyltransferase [Candidatus Eisenbacteria bacterium]|nr:glycosyltransferase [Candidatus Eisenbacteria bacterium]